MTLLVCEGLYAASDLADLLLASCSPEIRSNKTLCSLLDTAYKVLVIVLCVAALAQEVGFPIGSIVAGAGLVGLTISLAAQESASNLFSGIVILLDKPFSVGDWITVGDVEGEVIDINFRSTRIRSLDKTINVVTNSKICSSTVQNAALRTMRPYKFNLGVTYGTTRPKLEQLMKDLQTMLDASPYTNKGYQHRTACKLWRFQHQHSGLRLPADQRLRGIFADAERPEPEHYGHHAGRRCGFCVPLHQRVYRKELSKPVKGLLQNSANEKRKAKISSFSLKRVEFFGTENAKS